MKITKETVKRAIRTFWEAAVGYILSNIVLIPWAASSPELKAAVKAILATAIATGLAALMNLEQRQEGDRGGQNMTLETFVDKYLGTAIDYDGTAGAQCVDLIKLYLNKCYGVKAFSFGGSARMLYENYSKTPDAFREKFQRIPFRGELPRRGDIVVWGSITGGGHGHVAIATGDAVGDGFASWDMNWNGKSMKVVKHTNDGVLGYLRPIGAQQAPGATYFRRYTGTSASIVDALDEIRQPSSYNYRKQIAKANDINKYLGLPAQNRTLLMKLKTGTLIRP